MPPRLIPWHCTQTRPSPPSEAGELGTALQKSRRPSGREPKLNLLGAFDTISTTPQLPRCNPQCSSSLRVTFGNQDEGSTSSVSFVDADGRSIMQEEGKKKKETKNRYSRASRFARDLHFGTRQFHRQYPTIEVRKPGNVINRYSI